MHFFFFVSWSILFCSILVFPSVVMDSSQSSDTEFHRMDNPSLPYLEDRAVVLARDWPPAHEVYLKYQPTGQYLSISKGTLTLKTKPYVPICAP